MFVRLIRMVGLRDTGIILVQAREVPYVQFGRVFYMPTRACSSGYKLRSRESVCPQISQCDDELRVLSGSGIVFDLRM
jgi:hypothetical protein